MHHEEKKEDDEQQSLLKSLWASSGTNDRRYASIKEQGGWDSETSSPFHPQQRRRKRQSRCHTGAVFLVLVVLVTVSTHRLLALQKPVLDDNSLYDYIVVGAGPAGIIAATKLAQRFPELQVLLIEAGRSSQSVIERKVMHQHTDHPDRLNQYDIPLFWSSAATIPSSSSSHWKVPRTFLGKSVGGSALHNAMIYIRSLKEDWEGWNATGWDFETVLEEYRALENFLPVHPNISSKVRGTTGPIATSAPNVYDAVASLFIKSAVNAGIAETPSFNEGREGVGHYEFNIRHGIRDSVAAAILQDLPNLHLESGVTATRVLLGAVNNTIPVAVGVEYVRTVNATCGQFLLHKHGEVILAAGAILTPQLLVNSNIGDKVNKRKTHAYVPGVGKNLQDHPVVTIGFNLYPDISLDAPSIYTVGSEMAEYEKAALEMKNGAELTSQRLDQLGIFATAGFSAGAFLRSPWAVNASAPPDIQCTVFPRHLEPHVRLHHQQGERNHAMLVTVALMRPEARFEVKTSQSSQPLVTTTKTHDGQTDEHTLKRVLGYKLPMIDLPRGTTEYLTDHDVERLAWGVEQVRRIQNKRPLADHTGPELYPTQNGELNDYVRKSYLDNSHWAGSTAMVSDAVPKEKAVVDERLRVLGVQGLRIVDAGILPTVPNGNIHSTVCVVASRGAALIAEDRQKQQRHSPR